MKIAKSLVLAAISGLVVASMVFSGCKPAVPSTQNATSPSSFVSQNNTPQYAQDVVRVIKVFKVKQPFPPSGEWVRVDSPNPNPTSVQEVFSQNDSMYVGVRINPEYTSNVMFSKFTFFNQATGQEKEIGFPLESWPFKPGQIVHLGLTKPWGVPKEIGTYEIRIYQGEKVAASAVFQVANTEPSPNLSAYPHQISLNEATTIIDAELPVPGYLPENLSLNGIYLLEQSSGRTEIALTFAPKGSSPVGVGDIEKVPVRLYLRLFKGGQIGGLKLPGERYDISGVGGVLVTQNQSNDLLWVQNYAVFPGQFEMDLSADKDISKEELVKIARSVPQKGWTR